MKSKRELFIEFDKHLMEDIKPSNYFNSIIDENIMDVSPFYLLKDLVRTDQNLKHHPEGSVWNHTMMVIDKAASKKNLSKNSRCFMWAALLHDIGKAPTTKIRKSKITSYDHDKIGKKLTEQFLKELNCDDEFIKNVAVLVRWHMQPLFISKDMPFSDIRNMTREVSLEEIALLSICDRLGRGEMSEYKIKEEKKSIELFLKKVNKDK